MSLLPVPTVTQREVALPSATVPVPARPPTNASFTPMLNVPPVTFKSPLISVIFAAALPAVGVMVTFPGRTWSARPCR